jgi:hypothetical protein
MPPKKRLIPKAITEAPVANPVEPISSDLNARSEATGTEVMKRSESCDQTSECQQVVPFAKIEEKEESRHKIIRFDQVIDKTEEERLEERKAKFGLKA